jgi:endonuclease/exonuclease/phosphatase (EEP) superfamily protein YafD
MVLKRFLQLLGVLALLGVILPLIPAEVWWIRMFDYPHPELTLLTLLAFLLYFLKFNRHSKGDYIFTALLLIGFIWQAAILLPYTSLSSSEVPDSSKGNAQEIKILVANVLQKNNKYGPLLKKLKKADADIVLLTETDSTWTKKIQKAVQASYPYQVENPQDNTYGMLLYSKFKLIKPETIYSVQGKIPSIYSTVELPNGERFKLYCIHPTPPKPEHKRTDSDREKQITLIAKRAKQKELPVLVLGDFNEVAWSSNVQLFKDISGLDDVRVGRGLYSTFDATSFLMRWPLDQIFVSKEFRVKNIEVAKSVHSDHFPFQATLTFEP